MTEDPAALTLGEALDALPFTPTLCWGTGLPSLFARWRPTAGVRLASGDLRTARAFALPCEVTLVPSPGPESRIALLVPRAAAELDLMLAVAAARLPAGGTVLCAGHTQDGIKSAARPLAGRIGPVEVVRTKRHCRVLSARLEHRAPEPDLDRFALHFPAPSPLGVLPCASLPGTFAHGRLDAGTALLLQALAGVCDFTQSLDLGAGCGVLGAFLARRAPGAEVDLVDASASAVASSLRTLALCGVDRAKVGLGLADDLPAERYDLLVTNPPFHLRREVSRALSESFVRSARRALRPGGHLWLVANRALGYPALLAAHFRQVEERAANTAYQVFEARA